ncbi:MAG: protein phosphatase 2C domain-containing protein [Anaerolineaceae bacterium]|nr:protein phosphatase 2C domain-containing protein [Anaerolineaceae bacterium]
MLNLKLTVAGDSDVGIVRKNNEDYLTYFIPGDPQTLEKWGRLFIVADGVGGAASGEVASKFSAQKTLHTYYSQATMKPWQRIKVGMKRANTELVDYIRRNAQSRMATTMVAAALNGDEMTIVNVGDSRAYLMRNQEIKMITQDHNLVNEMIRNGVLTEEEAKTAKVKNQLTSSLGGHEAFKADVFLETLHPGDLIMLASDGLCRYAEDISIIKNLMLSGTPQQVVDNGVQFARKSGGQDNITVLMIRVDGAITGAFPLQEDMGTRPDPTTIEEVVKDPLTLVARSPEQEQKSVTRKPPLGLFLPAAAPAISITEAYAVPGINMAADDEELEDTGELTITIGNGALPDSEAAVINTVEAPIQPSSPSAQLREPQRPGSKDEKKKTGIQRISVQGYSLMIALAAILFIALAVVGFIFGKRYLSLSNKDFLTIVPTGNVIENIEVAEGETITEKATITPQTATTSLPTLEPTEEPVLLQPTGTCLALIGSGDTLKNIVTNQFDLVYEPDQEYIYYECDGSNETMNCGDPIIITDHTGIQPGWWLEIKDVEYETCLNDSGTWYPQP